ncbi:MAG: hypothetical protein HQK75_14695 [Candidatus Magnetomorum sp.]|nr:hypothetical protein [Candidatus Magnetomorum sp.]
MISVNQLKGNFINIYRSVWLASLGAIATVGQESKLIAEKVAKWDKKPSFKEVETTYRKVIAKIQENMGNFFTKMSIPRFAVN